MCSNRKNKSEQLGLTNSSVVPIKWNSFGFLRQQLFSFKSISTYLTSLSLFGIAHDGLRFGLSKLFQNALTYYSAFLAFAFQPIEFFLERIFKLLHFLFNWNFHLVGEWRHAFMVMGLYFLVDLRGSYIPRNLPKPAIISTGVFGLLIASTFSASGGYLGEYFNRIWAVFLPIIGFGVYELLKAPVSATYVRIPSFSWKQTFVYYSLLYGIGNIVLGILSLLMFMASPWASEPGAEVLVLVVFLFLLAIRNSIIAWIKASLIPGGAGRWVTFMTSGSIRIAINLLYALFLLLGYILTNAYLSNRGM